MMHKKFLSFIILTVMALSIVSAGFVCLAETSDLVETDLLFNGDMEWLGTSYSTWTGSHVPETEIVHGGEKSLKLVTTAASGASDKDNERQLYVQSISGLVPGQTYTLSCWLYTEDLVGGNYWTSAWAGMKIEIYSSSGSNVGDTTLHIYPNTESWQYGQWTYSETSIVCPEGASGKATIHVRHDGIGTVYYDDLKVTGPVTAERAAEIADAKTRYQEGYEISMNFYNEKNNYAANAVLA